MKIDIKIKKSIIWACENGQYEAVFDFINELIRYSLESGISIHDLREQLYLAQSEIESFEADPNDLKMVNSVCRIPYSLGIANSNI